VHFAARILPERPVVVLVPLLETHVNGRPPQRPHTWATGPKRRANGPLGPAD
jgi:hypothetical protein